MKAARLFAGLVCLLLMLYLCTPSSALFWASNFTFPSSRYTPAPGPQTATPTPTATPTGTPGALPSAITAMMGDIAPSTNPLSMLCASGTASASNNDTSGECTTRGSASVASIPTNGTDAGSALQTALNAGDVNLPAATYTINTQVNFPQWRTLQCQPGAVITTTSTSLKVFSFSGTTGEDTIIGCTFTGPGASPSNPAYAIYATGGQNINIIGNTFTNWPSSSAVTFASGATDDDIQMNLFSGNYDGGLNTSAATHIVSVLNNTGSLSPAIPSLTVSGGSSLEEHLWSTMAALGESGTIAGDGYSDVKPGATFGGATCHGNGSSDDTACIANALSAGTNGIVLEPGTGGTPYYTLTGTSGSSAIQGSQLTNKTIICEPGARFYNPNTASDTILFNFGGSGQSTGSNTNFIGCEMYGPYNNNSTYEVNRYSEMVYVAYGSSQVHVIGGDFEHCYGDCFITYASCGSANTGACGSNGQGSTPQTSGPNDNSVLFSNFLYSAQSMVHWNGGQNDHGVLLRMGDGDMHQEVDTTAMQYIAVGIDLVYGYSVEGEYDIVGNFDAYVSPGYGCTGRGGVGADSSGCYAHDLLADGSQTVSNGGTFYYPNIHQWLDVASGCTPAHYDSNVGINGGSIQGGGC